jgi:hypothetical protein
MGQRESRLSGKIMRELRQQPETFCFKVHGNEMMMAGLPDIVCCFRGRFVGLEVKLPEKRDNTSKRQDFVHGQIRRAKGKVYVVCSVEEAMKIWHLYFDKKQ